MLPLYLVRIEDLGRGDLLRVGCAACRHVALLTPDFLLRLGLSPQAKVLDLKWRVRCRGCGASRRFDQVAAREQVSRRAYEYGAGGYFARNDPGQNAKKPSARPRGGYGRYPLYGRW